MKPSSLLRLSTLVLALAGPVSAVSTVLKHDLGTTMLPAMPQRVVVNSEEVAEVFSVLGIRPVGYASGRIEGKLGQPTPNLTTLAAPVLSRSIFIGSYDQPSQELLAALKPDLIVLNSGDADRTLYPAMTRFAPTLAYDYDRTPWRTVLTDLGRVFGKSAQARQYLKTFDGRVATLKAQMAPLAARAPRTTLLYMYEPNSVMVLGRGFSFSKTLSQLGLTLNTPADIDPSIAFKQLSPEVLATLDTDRVLVLRVKKDGQLVARNATDTVLAKLGKPVYTYPLDPQEASSGPLTDLKRLEGLARLIRR